MGVFSAVAGNQLPNQLQKRVLPALFHLRCSSQSHQRSARGRTRLTTVTSISCRSFQRQLLYLTSKYDTGEIHGAQVIQLSDQWLRRNWQPVVEIASGKSAHQSFQKIAQRRAILIFSAILAKRGNASLGLNLDLHGYQIKTAVFMSPPVFFFFFSLMLYEVCSCVAPV